MPTDQTDRLRMFIGGLAVGLVIGVGGVLLATRPPAGPELAAIRSHPLSTADQSRVQDLLAAGNAHLRMENHEEAAAMYERVLSEFDCANVEARRGLHATAPDRLTAPLRQCGERPRG